MTQKTLKKVQKKYQGEKIEMREKFTEKYSKKLEELRTIHKELEERFLHNVKPKRFFGVFARLVKLEIAIRDLEHYFERNDYDLF